MLRKVILIGGGVLIVIVAVGVPFLASLLAALAAGCAER